jgi:hypothetical protein
MSIEKMRKLVAFYQGEVRGNMHPIEREYAELVSIEPRDRTVQSQDRLIVLANALIQAADVSRKAFKKELDKFMVKK